MGELALSVIPALTVEPFQATPVGLVIAGPTVPYEVWEAYGTGIQRVKRAMHWIIGDWLNYGERHYGETYVQALECTEYEYGTLRNDMWVTGQIELSRRRDNLSFAHHQEVAPLEPEEQDYWLEQAEVNHWGRNELRAKMREVRAVETPTLPLGRYRTIVIDPPWPIEKIAREVRPQQKAMDYPSMAVEAIGELDIPALVADGCHVYLWVTHKHLLDGLALFETWGITYQCLMTWVKPTGMTPFSWMYNTEHVLFGRVGNLDLERKGLKLSFEAPVTKHSEKPDVFYERVMQASPEPRLDMFARKPRDGFVVWGNEVLG